MKFATIKILDVKKNKQENKHLAFKPDELKPMYNKCVGLALVCNPNTPTVRREVEA